MHGQGPLSSDTHSKAWEGEPQAGGERHSLTHSFYRSLLRPKIRSKIYVTSLNTL